MTSRTTQTTIRFSSPFLLPGFDRPQPAGEYRVDYDEDMIDDISRVAWHRTGAFIHLPAIASQSLARQMVPVTQASLEAAIKKDNEQP